jgi:hypothetical protein
VQLWLRDHMLKERSPSRECTPTAAAAAAAAVKAGDALAAGSTAAGARNGCLLQNVLLGSEELQGWVMRQARSRATGEAACGNCCGMCYGGGSAYIERCGVWRMQLQWPAGQQGCSWVATRQ